MQKFLVGLLIVLFLTGVSLAVISCATEGTGSSSIQQSQPQKAPARGG